MSAVNWKGLVIGAGAIVLLGMIPLALDNRFLVQVSATAAVFAIAVLGYNLVLGETGLLSLGHAAFLGVGAYTYAILINRDVSAFLAILAAIALAAALALLIGVLTLRVRHVYFAIATFGAAEIIRNIIREWTPVTGGGLGIRVPPLEIFGRTYQGAAEVFPLAIGAVVLAFVVHQLVSASSLGRRMRAVRDDELAAGAMGIAVLRTELSVFVIGAAFAAFAGCLHAMILSFLDPSLLHVDLSVLLLAMLVVGGSGTAAGAIAGTIVIAIVPELLRFLENWLEFVYGAVILLAIIAGRSGMVGFAKTVWSKVRGLWRPAPTELGLKLGTFADYDFSLGPDGDLCIESLKKTFGGVTALTDVSTTFRSAEIHALIGPNGSGKSTLVNVVTGLYDADLGTVKLGERSLLGLQPHELARAGIARTFQHARSFVELSVLDNILPMVETAGLKGEEARREAIALLGAVGLGGTESRPVTLLPHGHLRLLEVARALALRPRVLLLDEPTAGLSTEESSQLSELLRSLAEAGLAVVVIEHNMPFVLRLATSVTVLEQGRVIARGTPDEIVVDPNVKRAYLGEESVESAGESKT
jgi:ABC-type branched-subunit amino acid transport system ATPase component/ABC-type branched-subunit amino acid transport system permease subunit